MKNVVAAFAGFSIAWTASAADLRCTVRHGVYKAPLNSELMEVFTRWPTVDGATFTVTRHSGLVAAEGFLSNQGEEVTVLRNIDQPVNSSNQYEVMSVAKTSGVKLLSIDVLDGQLFFKYYLSTMGLLLTGECIDT